jgi:hypothetical protein
MLAGVVVALIAMIGCNRSDESPASSSAATSTAPRSPLGQLAAKLVSPVIIEATGDTFVRGLTPNQNMGGDTRLSVQAFGAHRSLVFFDPALVLQRVGGGTVVSARMDLTLSSVSGGWTQAGRPISIHRLLSASNEQQATWSCAIDANLSNFQPDCSGADAWSMEAIIPAQQPWLSPATATVTVRDGQTGVVSFDVTADVVAMVTGADPGHGWLIKKVDELLPGALEFSSREGEAPPRLVLDVDGAPNQELGPVTGSVTLVSDRDTDVRHLQPNQNFGDAARMRIQALGKNRGVVGFDAQALGTALGGALVRARLRLPIAETSIGWGPDRAVGVHRMRRSWTELGATWNCGFDPDLGNSIADCSGTSAWSMSGPVEELAWLAPPTDTGAGNQRADGDAGVRRHARRRLLVGGTRALWRMARQESHGEPDRAHRVARARVAAAASALHRVDRRARRGGDAVGLRSGRAARLHTDGAAGYDL